MYDVDVNDTVDFDYDDFDEFVYDETSGTEVGRVWFTELPSSREGTLYRDYDKRDQEEIDEDEEIRHDEIDDLTFVPKRNFEGAVTIPFAVSYTHLDVYKRQIFNLLCAPCFAAMGAIKREMNNARWTLGAIGYMCGFAYVVSLIVYQLGGLITGEVSFGIGTIAAAAALVGLVYLLVRRDKYDENTLSISAVAAAAK